MSIARHHAEWLSLLEIDGPFLSMPVLLRAFPQGLYADDPELARELRLAYEEWHDPAFRCLCVELRMAAEGGDPNPEAVFVVFNTGAATPLHLPETASGWELLLDTTRPDLPEDGLPAATW